MLGGADIDTGGLAGTPEFPAKAVHPSYSKETWLLVFGYESLISQPINLLALQKQGYHSSAQKISKNYVRKN